jgi:hypothetical protein
LFANVTEKGLTYKSPVNGEKIISLMAEFIHL